VAYGTPENNFLAIARHWNMHLANRGIIKEGGECLHEGDVALLLIYLKGARLSFNPSHLDSWCDIAGYGACGAEVTGAK
jgi:hypothetical protein